MKDGGRFEVTVGDSGKPTTPWVQALEKPRAALDPDTQAAMGTESKGCS